MKRFKNEAQAAAGLHHQNIVPVYGVGCERGVHCYAMQYIDGQTLAEVIRDLRRIDGLDDPQSIEIQAVSELAEHLASGCLGTPEPGERPDERTTAWSPGEEMPDTDGHRNESSAGEPGEDDTKREPQAAVSTERSARSSAYFRNIAQLAIQVAEALDHAHQEGNAVAYSSCS